LSRQGTKAWEAEKVHVNANRVSRREFWRIALMGAASLLSELPLLNGEERGLRIGVSAETLAGSNLNDARAAYKVWGQELKKALGLSGTELLPDVFIPSDHLVQMIRNSEIDCFVLTAWEYAKVVDFVDMNWMLVEDVVADGVEYILVVHNASPYQRLDDLRNSTFVMHHHRDTVLLRAWIALQLSKVPVDRLDSFFLAEHSPVSLTQVVLPVFFRHIDVAGLTRSAFNTAVELNPQLGKDLRVLASSPKVIPTAFFFRRGCRPQDLEQLKNALVKLKALPSGQQVLELYQAKGFTACHGSLMKDTLAIVRRYERLFDLRTTISPKPTT
jgi:ABC-type phosphate/phosphonate transport system substrate-binding protein